MRIFKNKWFSRFARRQGIEDQDLCEAMDRAERGLIDADLGGGVIKQRIARPNEGKSGGFRSVVIFRAGARAFFVYGFPKSDRSNIRSDELTGFKELAAVMLAYTDQQLKTAIETDALTEVTCYEQDLSQ